MDYCKVSTHLLHVCTFYFWIKFKWFLTKGNGYGNLPGPVGIGSWSELGHDSRGQLFVVVPRARVLGRTSVVLPGKIPVWEQAGKNRARGRGGLLVGQHPRLCSSGWASPGVRMFCSQSHLDCLLRVGLPWPHPRPADLVSVGCCLGISMLEKLSG